jgi:hypothetical protein
MITDVTDILLMLANVYQILTNVYPVVVKESSAANLQKIVETNHKMLVDG